MRPAALGDEVVAGHHWQVVEAGEGGQDVRWGSDAAGDQAVQVVSAVVADDLVAAERYSKPFPSKNLVEAICMSKRSSIAAPGSWVCRDRKATLSRQLPMPGELRNFACWDIAFVRPDRIRLMGVNLTDSGPEQAARLLERMESPPSKGKFRHHLRSSAAFTPRARHDFHDVEAYNLALAMSPGACHVLPSEKELLADARRLRGRAYLANQRK